MQKAMITAGLTAPLFLMLVAVPARAQKVSAQGRAIPVYDSAHEITVQGNIERIVAQPSWGAPIGTHVMVATPGGLVDAHLGRFVTKGTSELNLHTGDVVHIVGAMAMIEGKQVLLARTLTVGGQTLVIRNERGFLVQPGAATSRSKASVKGGS